MSFFRRFVSGVYPLLVWAEDSEAADVTAAIHASKLPPIFVIDISGDGSAQRDFETWLQKHAGEADTE